MKRVVLGMSGGVDSSVAAALLVEQGYEVQGVTLQTWESEDGETVSKKWQERGCCKVGIAKYVAERLGISHRVVDIRERFRSSVIQDFIGGYLSGETPNPCVRCNERVKFGSLIEAAETLAADYVATGHYVRVLPNDAGQSGGAMAKAAPCEWPKSAKRSRAAASTTASMSRTNASKPKLLTFQSERPQPRSSMRTSV